MANADADELIHCFIHVAAAYRQELSNRADEQPTTDNSSQNGSQSVGILTAC